jgi:hypothetical protein
MNINKNPHKAIVHHLNCFLSAFGVSQANFHRKSEILPVQLLLTFPVAGFTTVDNMLSLKLVH